MNNRAQWLDDAKKRLDALDAQDSEVLFDHLRVLGIIDDQGEVTGHLHRWDAHRAIVAVKRRAGGAEIETFHCLNPVFGIPGGEPVDVSREQMVEYLKAGKKVITAYHDDRLGLWREGCLVHLTPSGFVSCASADDSADNVGKLPERASA